MINSASEFVRLRNSENKDDYDRAAHDEAPLEVWWQVIREHPEMKTWVVTNKTVPLPILEALSTDEDSAVRDAVARKRKASRDILERLARDSDSGVRLAVAYNKSTSVEVLKDLVNDPWESVASHAKARLGIEAGQERSGKSSG
jgi:hypothetical protein